MSSITDTLRTPAKGGGPFHKHFPFRHGMRDATIAEWVPAFPGT